MSNFYCQKLCGEVGFSIDEWNKAREEYKTLTPDGQQYMDEADDSGVICQTQCEACKKIVLHTRVKNKAIREIQNKKNGKS